MSTPTLRPELPELPERMRNLPLDHRGYPVPWFVCWLDEDNKPQARGVGKPDFRILAPNAPQEASRENKCWLCGKPMGSYKAFVIGPMCAINRVSAEPPSHLDCADFAARACPFLARPHAKRRDAGMPEDTLGFQDLPGIALERNPGVALVWVTRRYDIERDPNGGNLFRVGDPTEVRWYAEGRKATREEVMHSIETGFPALKEMAESEGPRAVAQLTQMTEVAMELVPA